MSFGTPVFVVTHDRIEALALSDFILVLNEGRVCQSGPAHEVFTHPGNITVAHIVGVETSNQRASCVSSMAWPQYKWDAQRLWRLPAR